MRVHFLFLDGVGLAPADPARNPLARAVMPNLQALLGGRRLVTGSAPPETERATVVPLDACLGVDGLPQSATGQATLLTGRNLPLELGYHYGPKPNAPIASYLRNGNLFKTLAAGGHRAALLNAYPPAYFEAIASGRRLYSAIPLAATSAGLSLKTAADLFAGRAVSADFTGQGWRERLNYPETPLLEPEDAGVHLARLAEEYDFSMFEFWMSDYAGHHQDMAAASDLLATFDRVLGGLLAAWNDDAGVLLITSDHGNIEDLNTRGHTTNAVPALLIGSQPARRSLAASLHSLTDVAPGIERLVTMGAARNAQQA